MQSLRVNVLTEVAAPGGVVNEAAAVGPHLLLIAVGVVLGLGLLAAFVLGQRRKDREPPPVLPAGPDRPSGPAGERSHGAHRRGDRPRRPRG
ncbi:DUF6479 family protein [Kitasatospora sp. NBC_00315]|uniref:DUF6479 family protein n=1 Tax=Kitasatospora sp. NBC_00315 TaxID=2975963 RepID=UPI0032543088